MDMFKFDNYKSLRIYMHDHNKLGPNSLQQATFQELGFDSINPPVKIKILSNGAIDIVNENGQFISDIQLSLHQKSYISNIDESKCDFYSKYSKKVEKVKNIENYEDGIHWALTSKMRHYTLGFKFAYEFNDIRDWLTKRLIWDEDDEDYDQEDEDYDQDYENDVNDEEYEDHDDNDQEHDGDEIEFDEFGNLRGEIINWGPEESDDDGVSIDSDDEADDGDDDEADDDDDDDDDYDFLNEPDEGINNNESNHGNDFAQIFVEDVVDGKIAHSEVMVPLTTMFYKMFRFVRNPDHSQNFMVFEYFYDKCNYCTVNIIHPEVVLVEMFVKHQHLNDGGNSAPVVRAMTIIVFDSLNSDGGNMSLHKEDGSSDGGVNFYRDASGVTKGVIFGGADDKNYALAMNDCNIVPDILISSEAVSNLTNFKIPQTKSEENFWYNYKAHKEAAASIHMK